MKIPFEEISKYGKLDFFAKSLVEGFITGLHKSPFHGFSVEFAEHRLYNFGESTRHIDWKVFSRTDRLYTKRYEEETNLRSYFILDNSSSMYYPVDNYGKIRFGALGIAALSYLMQRQSDAFGLFTFSDEIEHYTQVKSSLTHYRNIVSLLEQSVQPERKQRKTDLAKVLHQMAIKIHRRSLVVLFTDMIHPEEDMEALYSALQHLKHNKNEVIVFHVKESETEDNFVFEDRPYEFINIETDERIKLTPDEVKKHYVQKNQDAQEQLRNRLMQLKIDYVPADINEGLDQVLTSYLIKRQKMG